MALIRHLRKVVLIMSVSTNAKQPLLGCSPAYVINSVVTLAIMIGFKLVVPASEPLTPLGVEVLGIFLGMLYGWLVVGDVVWPSIAGLVCLGSVSYTHLDVYKRQMYQSAGSGDGG